MTSQKKGIRALVGCSVAIFWPGAFIFGFPGVMAPYWQSTFQVSRGAVGNILFFVLAAVGLFMFLVGRWQERIGIRKMISLGSIICGLSMFILVFATNILMVYLWAFLTGAASCLIYIPSLTCVQRWYLHRRGLVSGVVNLMFGFSAAVMAPVFGYLFIHIGYLAMIMTVGLTALVIGTVAAQFTEAPSEVSAPNSKAQLTATAPISQEDSLTVEQSIRTRSFWLLWLTWALQGSGGIAMVTLSTSYGLSRDFPLESAVIILAVFNLANGLSRLASGYMSDLAGRNLTMSITFFAAGLAYLLLPRMTDLFGIAALAAIIGFAFGTLFAVSAPLVVDCFGIKHFGSIFGLIFTAYGFVAGPLGPSLSGYILDSTNGNFSIVFSYLGVFCLVSGMAIRLVLPPKPASTEKCS
ncbi:MAG: MFS transporter [Deltaproteobacteria bacterium]|nr:MFS transporter [Deltaproteobacteria bacterium]